MIRELGIVPQRFRMAKQQQLAQSGDRAFLKFLRGDIATRCRPCVIVSRCQLITHLWMIHISREAA